jgi:23S rRNA pseudouridine1911/1915/1917 synthase
MSRPNRAPLFEMKYGGERPVAISECLKEHGAFSTRGLRKYFFKGLIFLNRRRAHSEAIIKPGDTVQVYPLPEETTAVIPEPLPLEIVFENDELLIINKPPRMAVHPVKTFTTGTLANAVAHYFQTRSIAAKVRPVHRLDYGTSGLVIFAKDARSQALIGGLIEQRRIKRIYYALVQGAPETERGMIDQPIGVQNGRRLIDPSGQPARTRFTVIERYREVSLLELTLETGRTHQIRVHVQAIGHPLLGDAQYGIASNLIKRPALHAGKIVFSESGLALPDQQVRWLADFQAAIDRLKTETGLKR